MIIMGSVSVINLAIKPRKTIQNVTNNVRHLQQELGTLYWVLAAASPSSSPEKS